MAGLIIAIPIFIIVVPLITLTVFTALPTMIQSIIYIMLAIFILLVGASYIQAIVFPPPPFVSYTIVDGVKIPSKNQPL